MDRFAIKARARCPTNIEVDFYKLVRPRWFSLRPSELEGRAAAGSRIALGTKSGIPTPGKATSLSREGLLVAATGWGGAGWAPLKTAQVVPDLVWAMPTPPRVEDSRSRFSL
ncbi:MAG: hypothetical protein ABS33_06985 [Verrucomicrobia subdivision 6 bacterium BACL9 MAG-120924-bin69]|uniref:Uncharacterized protein n=1 Tax=Verrucomicrobia subdivision 6 bacterium BACL9 MAG-120924-bin69 TaxID=1655635 RepID=A0A0R2XCB0_9BACT|nr:MAG: hypothetical protein ABS33_06985 [Verrucomicrobia subdivision 6 bacterium BACL9 MAG-120924-bin69]